MKQNIANGATNHLDIVIMIVTVWSSVDKFIEGGTAMLEASNISNHIATKGDDTIRFFAMKNLRLLIVLYIKFLILNSPEDDSAWLIIIITLVVIAYSSICRQEKNTMFMCTIELQATSSL